MFLVIWRVAGRGEVYDDKVVLLTKDLMWAVDKAKKHQPFGWRSPELGGQAAHRAYVFRAAPEKSSDNGPDLVYARQTRKYGRKIGWVEYWGLPMWKKAYERHRREFEREVIKDLRRIVREQVATVKATK